MMPRTFDAALKGFLGQRDTLQPPVEADGLDGLEQRDTPPADPKTSGLDGLGRVRTFLDMPLGEFQHRGALIEVRVPWLDVSLWMVPGEQDVAMLLAEGVSRGRIWTAAELLNLMSITPRTPDDAQTITHAKLAIDGEISAVRERRTS
jgi:hypothetical protein